MALPPNMLSLAQAASRFIRISEEIHVIDKEALEIAGQIIETEAKRVLGTYDYGWTPLKPETVARKQMGDSPLLETGELHDSIGHMVIGNMLYVGSDNPKAAYHEFGTSRIPPRPFLSGAAATKAAEIAHYIGHAVSTAIVASMISGRVIAGRAVGVAYQTGSAQRTKALDILTRPSSLRGTLGRFQSRKTQWDK
jgi:phage gpG-like protein